MQCTNQSTQKIYYLGIFLALAFLFNACTTETNQSEVEKTPVKFQLSWLHSVENAGVYLAKENGYYADEGLELEIFPGGYDENGEFINPIDQVMSGKADFGILDGATLLSSRAQGIPIVAVASIYQRQPLAFSSLAEKNIIRPQDLVGKTVHVSFSSLIIYQAMLNAQGIDPDEVNMVNRTDYTGALLTSGQADVIDAWVITEVPELTFADQELNLIFPSDYGVDVYPNIIFTTEDTLANRPEMVEKFVKVSIKGMQEAFDDPDAAAKLVFEKYATKRGLEVEQEAMQRSLPLLIPPDSSPGQMKPEVWERTHEILLEQGILSEPIDLEAAYTLNFTE